MIEPYADMVKIHPYLTDVSTNPPGPGLSRFRCFLFFTYEDSDLIHAQSRIMWLENVREFYYNMDKEYSRVNSMLAIPRLVTEMNILRDPQRALERFMRIALGSGLSGTSTEEAGEDSEVSLD